MAALGVTVLARIWSAISSEVAMSCVPIGRRGEVALSEGVCSYGG
jgi:hypothetical protein